MDLLKQVKEKLPQQAEIAELRFEASEAVVYSESKEFFLKSSSLLKRLVRELKKRIHLRPAPAIRLDEDKAADLIKKIVSERAGIQSIRFEKPFGRVIIDATRPGLVIGKDGRRLEQIKSQIFWSPHVRRIPKISTKIVELIRKTLHKSSLERKKFLHKTGERIYSEGKELEWVRLTGLGGYKEVGKSCSLLQTPSSRILLDCGIEPGGNRFPELDVPEFHPEELDAVICSHPHLDHCGFIPYLYEFGYKGPLYCTEPTRDLMVLLCLDYINVFQQEGRKAPYQSASIKEAIKRCIPLQYGQVTDIASDLRLTFEDAGHILGSSLVHLNIGEGEHNLLFTGDFNFERSRLFDRANPDFQRVETLLMESTYGGPQDTQPLRADAEQKLLDAIQRTVKRGGKVLIPVFAVGRSQELMCILEANKKKLERIPIYLEGMLWDSSALHVTHSEYLRTKLCKRIHSGDNPFQWEGFRRVGSEAERKKVIESTKPLIVLATSGMLVGGPVLEYLKAFATNNANSLLFVGYQAAGTLGRKIQDGWEEIPIELEKKREALPIRLEIITIEGLSGHSDRNQLVQFVSKLPKKPTKIITCHGDNNRCIQLTKDLHKLYGCRTLAPGNLETVRIF